MTFSSKYLSWLLLGSLVVVACSSTESSSSLPTSVKASCELQCEIRGDSCPDDPANSSCKTECSTVASSAAAVPCKSNLVGYFNCINEIGEVSCNDTNAALIPKACENKYNDAIDCATAVGNGGTAGAGGAGGTAGTAGAAGTIGPSGNAGAAGTIGPSGTSGASGSSPEGGSAGVGGTTSVGGAAGEGGGGSTSGTSGVGGTGGTSGGWTCDPAYQTDTYCDCECGLWDTACETPGAPDGGQCGTGETCIHQGSQGVCSTGTGGASGASGTGGASGASGASGAAGTGGTTGGTGGTGGLPAGWDTTNCPTYYGDGYCDCNCNAWDIDCNDAAANSTTADVYGCNAGEVCVKTSSVPYCQ